MKFWSAILISTLFSFSASAQKNHVSLSMGLAYPLSEYAESNDYYSHGFANPGFNLSFEGNYIPLWYVGVGGAASFTTNYTQSDKYFEALVDAINRNPVSQIPDETLVLHETDRWSYVNLVVGPTLAIPLNRLQWNIKGFAGISIILPPTQSLIIPAEIGSYSHSGDAQNIAFSYLLGTDLIYKLMKNYSIILNAAYTHTQSKSQSNLSYTVDEQTTILSPFNKTTDIQSIHLTLGLAYLF
ncbi:MAG: hypothetical protein AB7S69_01245 [Salinivirgaceae bacterium]